MSTIELKAALKAMLDNYGPPLESIDYPDSHPITLARTALAKEDDEPPHVRRFLDLSTAHVSPEALIWLQAQAWLNGTGHDGDHMVAGFLNGWIVYAPDEESLPDSALHPSLCDAARIARSLDCSYMLFDQDAEEIEGLARYEWGEPAEPTTEGFTAEELAAIEAAAAGYGASHSGSAYSAAAFEIGTVDGRMLGGSVRNSDFVLMSAGQHFYSPETGHLSKTLIPGDGVPMRPTEWPLDAPQAPHHPECPAIDGFGCRCAELRAEPDDAGLADELAEPGELEKPFVEADLHALVIVALRNGANDPDLWRLKRKKSQDRIQAARIVMLKAADILEAIAPASPAA